MLHASVEKKKKKKKTIDCRHTHTRPRVCQCRRSDCERGCLMCARMFHYDMHLSNRLSKDFPFIEHIIVDRKQKNDTVAFLYNSNTSKSNARHLNIHFERNICQSASRLKVNTAGMCEKKRISRNCIYMLMSIALRACMLNFGTENTWRMYLRI